jgi:hypothetical protein
MALTHSPSIVTNGLVLCLDAANRKSYPGSGNTWTDLSGNGNTGTLSATSIGYNSANGGILTFDGTDDYVSSTLPALTSYTTSAWVRLRIPNAGEYQLLQTFNDGFGMSVLTNKFFTYNGGNNFGQTVANDVWYNWVVTSTNTPSNSTKIIINTIVDGTFSSYGAISSGAIALAGYVGQSRYLNADISSFTVYNRVLTAAEIAQNYNALKGRYGLS